MSTSPQFRQAIIKNLEKLNSLNFSITPHATLNMHLEDYSKHSYLRKQKSRGLLRTIFLQKAF